MEEKDDSLNEWINDEAVYRTAPATPGLLNMFLNIKMVPFDPWSLIKLNRILLFLA